MPPASCLVPNHAYEVNHHHEYLFRTHTLGYLTQSSFQEYTKQIQMATTAIGSRSSGNSSTKKRNQSNPKSRTLPLLITCPLSALLSSAPECQARPFPSAHARLLRLQ